MPVIGYFVATQFAESILAYDHWVAFVLLLILGGRMIAGSFKKDGRTDSSETSLKPSKMLPLAVATSIDALAVGVSFALLQINIVPAASLIGATTLLFSMAGVKIGNVFGVRFKSKAELLGGVILVLIGLNILFEHLF
jgi:putative Mn2+ efflux pump MntP